MKGGLGEVTSKVGGRKCSQPRSHLLTESGHPEEALAAQPALEGPGPRISSDKGEAGFRVVRWRV